MHDPANERDLVARFWTLLGGGAGVLDALAIDGNALLPAAAYDVNALATASIAVATLAVAELQAARSAGAIRRVLVHRGHCGAAFRSERYLAPIGWQLPEIWDPIAGDYETKDGWIRLHTNYRSHRDAALEVLAVPADRDAVGRAVASWEGEALETAVVAAGGCAAAMRSPDDWRRHPQGEAVAREPLLSISTHPAPARATMRLGAYDATEGAPLAGVRVLRFLTHVIAGPVCTRTLAAFGADVLPDRPSRVRGGRRAPPRDDGRKAARGARSRDRRRARDVGGARRRRRDVILVHGYRSDRAPAAPASAADERLLALPNPRAVVVCHDAYGWSGPWATRRGFDSLVQMSCGIAWRGRELAGASRPTPLSAQALDHATGYLLAASACRGLTRLVSDGAASETRLSLAATAECLLRLPPPPTPLTAQPSPADIEPWLEEAPTDLGPVRRVRYPGAIEGVDARWTRAAGRLGVDEARWT